MILRVFGFMVGCKIIGGVMSYRLLCGVLVCTTAAGLVSGLCNTDTYTLA